MPRQNNHIALDKPRHHHHHHHTNSSDYHHHHHTNTNSSNYHHSREEKVPSVSIQHDFEHIFRQLYQDIEQSANILQSVRQFKQHIEPGLNEGVFDTQDLQWITEDETNLEKELKTKEEDLRKRKEIYEHSVLKLEKLLDKRKKMIEEGDRQTNVFAYRPELLKKFAQKRAELMKMTEQGKKEVCANKRSVK